MDISKIKPILDSLELPQLIEYLQTIWEEEQRRRHEFWENVDEGKKAEFIQGEVIYHSPIYGRHWMVSTNICRYIIPHVYDNDLGKIGYEKVMIRLTRNDYEPDICFWSKEKSSKFELTQSAFPPPDFIIEILSESTKDRDRGIKYEDYALHEVGEYWIIDPDRCSVEQYLLNKGMYQLALKIKDGTITSDVISGFTIHTNEIFNWSSGQETL